MDIMMFIAGTIKVLLGLMGLGLIFSPIILIGLAVVMILCGRFDILKVWFRKYGLTNNNSLHRYQLKNSMLHESKLHERNNLGFTSKVNALSDEHRSLVASKSLGESLSNRTINSASGLPMVGSSPVDICGNTFGTRRL